MSLLLPFYSFSGSAIPRRPGSWSASSPSSQNGCSWHVMDPAVAIARTAIAFRKHGQESKNPLTGDAPSQHDIATSIKVTTTARHMRSHDFSPLSKKASSLKTTACRATPFCPTAENCVNDTDTIRAYGKFLAPIIWVHGIRGTRRITSVATPSTGAGQRGVDAGTTTIPT